MTYTVLREFKIRGTVQPVGSVLQLPEQAAIQLKDYVQPVGKADNWDNTPTARLSPDGTLLVTGVFAGDYPTGGLAPEIVRLTSGNMELQNKLLKIHVGVFTHPCWPSIARKFVSRAAELFEEQGLGLHAANWKSAEELHLLAFEQELGITFHKPE